MSSCTSRGAAAARGGSDAATADGSRDACTAETARARGATGSQAPMISEAVGPGLMHCWRSAHSSCCFRFCRKLRSGPGYFSK